MLELREIGTDPTRQVVPRHIPPLGISGLGG